MPYELTHASGFVADDTAWVVQLDIEPRPLHDHIIAITAGCAADDHDNDDRVGRLTRDK